MSAAGASRPLAVVWLSAAVVAIRPAVACGLLGGMKRGRRTAAAVATPGFDTLLDCDTRDHQGGDRVGPRPAEQPIQAESGQQHRR